MQWICIHEKHLFLFRHLLLEKQGQINEEIDWGYFFQSLVIHSGNHGTMCPRGNLNKLQSSLVFL